MPPVTVAVVSWNTCALLARCLDAFKADADRGLAEVWVVDNASSDGSPELVRDEYPWVKLIASQENLGFSRALNAVADRTESPWFVVANADIAVHPGALDTLIATAERDPRAAVVAPRLVMPDGKPQHNAGAFPTIPFSLWHLAGMFRFDWAINDRLAVPGRMDLGRRRRIPWAIGAFLLVRREAWDAVGGFDPTQWMYAEDLDFGWRLRQAGWATRIEPLALVEHEVSASTSQQFGDERAPVWQRATYACIARRRSPGYARVIAAINLLNALSRTPGLLRRAPHAAGAHRRWIGVHLEALRGAR